MGGDDARTPTGRFLVLEGPDGSGKSTQAARLMDRLSNAGLRPVHLRDPGTTRVGEKVREILLDPEHLELDPVAEALLFMAARAQLIAERIKPERDAGRIVVCERWLPSTVCYQGYAGGLDPESIWAMGEFASGGLTPDLTLVLDVSPEVGLSRVGAAPDLVESRGAEFQAAVRAGYHEIVREGRMNSRLIPAGTPDAVAEAIREAVDDVL